MTKKILIRIGIVIAVIGVTSFSDWSFAAGNETMENLNYYLYVGISFLSWAWVLLAKVAGTFLTNNWIYGEYLGLDVLLWKYWNIVRNIANFGLGFYFVYVIGKGLIEEFSEGKERITKNLKNILLWLLVAGVGIQSSWFLTAAVIDVSTITLAAVGSFPSQVISENVYIEGAVRENIKNYFGSNGENLNIGKELSFLGKNADKLLETIDVNLNESADAGQVIDSIMPSADDVSGPLHFLGFSILKANEVAFLKTDNLKSTKATIINLFLQGGTTIIYSIEMAVLCVIALIRIIYLWMFIVLSPIAILLWCIGKISKIGGNDGKGLLNTITEQIKFKTFLINVFKPTIIVLGFGIAVIFVTLMHKVEINYADGSVFDMNGVTLTSTSLRDGDGNINYMTTMDNDLLSFSLISVGKTLLELILAIITVIGVYLIIKMAVTIGNGKDFASKRFTKIQDTVGGLMSSLPVMPVTGYDNEGVETTRYVTAGTILDYDKTSGTLKSKFLGKKINDIDGKLKDVYNEQIKVVDSWFGDEIEYLSADERNNIEKAGGTNAQGLEKLKAKKVVIENIKSEGGKGMTLNPDTSQNERFWIKDFGYWLTSMKGKTVTGTNNDEAWNSMIQAWNSSQTTDIEKKIKEIFEEHNERAKAYAEFFELGNVNGWDDLKNKDISKK